MSQSEKTETEKRAKVRQMIHSIRSAVLVTRTPSGHLHGRPMSTADLEENWDSIWFATSRKSPKVDEVRQDDHVLLSYASGAEFVSVSGRASLVTDREKIKSLWSPLWKNWFSGPDDPNLSLLQVTPEAVEYWDSGSQVFALAKMAMSAVTGKHFSVGENERLSLVDAAK